MNGEFLTVIIMSLWTGILTSISPCPLGTNIAALTWISKNSTRDKPLVLWHGLLYTGGRSLSYIIIGFVIAKSLISAPSFSFFMQKYGNQALSPILILAGMYMLNMFGQNFSGFSFLNMSKFKPKSGSIPSFIMGMIFAMAFCPISAALYFGVIIPLSVNNSAPLSIPLFYGLGTALPVIAIAVIVDFGIKKISTVSAFAVNFEKYARPATGWIFIAIGFYLALKYIFL